MRISIVCSGKFRFSLEIATGFFPITFQHSIYSVLTRNMDKNDEATTEEVPCTFTFKKSVRRSQNQRQRGPPAVEEKLKTEEEQNLDVSSSPSSSDSDTKIRFAQKKARRSNPLVQSTGGRRNKKSEKAESTESSSDEDAETRKDKSRLGIFYESSKTGERSGPSDMGATSIVETETEKEHDAQTIFQKSLDINKELKGKDDDGIYRGINNYKRFYDKRDTAQGNAASNRIGPMRAPDNIRVTVRWDYQPDICKDYKETGFCGFGDSCKFLHDRSDYKFGWQIEREVAEGRYGKDDTESEKYEIPDDEEHLPFKCFICRNSFVDPIVTKCKHYFCEKCALQHFRKSQRCFVCGQPTRGVFNPAKEIVARLKLEAADAAAAGASGSHTVMHTHPEGTSDPTKTDSSDSD